MSSTYIKISRKLFIYSFSVIGWGIICYIFINLALSGSIREYNMNRLNEMLIELIIGPVFLIVLIISVILEARDI